MFHPPRIVRQQPAEHVAALSVPRVARQASPTADKAAVAVDNDRRLGRTADFYADARSLGLGGRPQVQRCARFDLPQCVGRRFEGGGTTTRIRVASAAIVYPHVGTETHG